MRRECLKIGCKKIVEKNTDLWCSLEHKQDFLLDYFSDFQMEQAIKIRVQSKARTTDSKES